jgi:dihydrofolate reductase
MRKIVMFNRVTPDGYFANREGTLDWVVPDGEVDKAGAAGIPNTDTVLFGRRTYEQFAAFWPKALEIPETPNPHGGGNQSPETRAFAAALTAMTKIVYSKTLKRADWKNSRIEREFDPGQIEAMKKQPGKDIIVFGSGSIVSLLARHGLIDEYTFVVNPVLLGGGKTLVSELPRTVPLRLLETKSYPTGNVVLHYAPQR